MLDKWRTTAHGKATRNDYRRYVVGLVFQGQRLPAQGETVIGDHFQEGPGGKGSNQAVAALRLGAAIRLIARIGRDVYGQNALDMYRRFGLGAQWIAVNETAHTGIGAILVDRDGRNLISVVPGANAKLCRQDIDAAEEVIAGSSLVGCQLETPLEIADYALRKAHRLGAATLLDPAPAVPLPDDLYPCLDFIKPNETEAGILTGITVDGIDRAAEAGRWLVRRGVKNALIQVEVERAMKRMTLHQRMMAVYRGQLPDQVPVAIYSRYLPRGTRERAAREMGLAIIDWHPVASLLAPPWHLQSNYLSEVKGAELSVRFRSQDGRRIERRTYQTPVGDVFQESSVDPTYGSDWIQRFYIQTPEDYKVMTWLVEHTVFRRHESGLHRPVRRTADSGSDAAWDTRPSSPSGAASAAPVWARPASPAAATRRSSAARRRKDAAYTPGPSAAYRSGWWPIRAAPGNSSWNGAGPVIGTAAVPTTPNVLD